MKTRHGMHAAKIAIRLRGMAAIDARFAAARGLREWRTQLIRDLGGNLSTQQSTLVDLCCRTKLLLDHADSFLVEQRSLVNRRTKKLLPVVRERQALADALARYLALLGLDRKETPAPTVEEFVREFEREKGATT